MWFSNRRARLRKQMSSSSASSGNGSSPPYGGSSSVGLTMNSNSMSPTGMMTTMTGSTPVSMTGMPLSNTSSLYHPHHDMNTIHHHSMAAHTTSSNEASPVQQQQQQLYSVPPAFAAAAPAASPTLPSVTNPYASLTSHHQVNLKYCLTNLNGILIDFFSLNR